MSRSNIKQVRINEQRKNLNAFLESASYHKAYAVESDIKGLAYVTKDNEFGIVTCSGNVRMSIENALKMCKEITGIIEDVKHIKSCYRGQV